MQKRLSLWLVLYAALLAWVLSACAPVTESRVVTTYSEREAELQAQLAGQKVNAQKLLQMIVGHAEVIEQLRHDLSMLRTRQEFHERAFHAPQLTPPPNKAAPAEPQEEVAGSWFLPLGVTTSTTPFNAEPAAQVVQPEPKDARWAMIEMD